MLRYSVIIPTFNRRKDLLLTLPNIAKYLDTDAEVIVVDQSNNYDPKLDIDKIEAMFTNKRLKYYFLNRPSLPDAMNFGIKQALGEIIFCIDDDMDIEPDFFQAHLRHYKNDNTIIGVAGGYYAGTRNSVWIPSSKKGYAITSAMANLSVKKLVFSKVGVASYYLKPFAPIDWEVAEVLSNYGKLAVGDDCLAFHRAPANGGCENQSERTLDWYYGTYHNHFLWMFSRSFPASLLKLPRHVFILIKYVLPKRKYLLSFDYLKTIYRAFCDALHTYRTEPRVSFDTSEQSFILLFQSKPTAELQNSNNI